jgi:hypothetical protein
MSKMIDQAYELIKSKLEIGERILSVGYFRQGIPLLVALITSSGTYAWKLSFIGITNKRLFILPFDNFSFKINNNIEVFPLSIVDLSMDGKNLFIRFPNNSKPQKFVWAGILKVIGLDINEFKKAISDGKK